MDLHGVFAVTIYGDRIRVMHYMDWGNAIGNWDWYEKNKNWWPIIKFFCVRSWDDPDWNTARYRPHFNAEAIQ